MFLIDAGIEISTGFSYVDDITAVELMDGCTVMVRSKKLMNLLVSTSRVKLMEGSRLLRKLRNE